MLGLFGQADGIGWPKPVDLAWRICDSFCVANAIDAQIRCRGQLWVATRHESQLGSMDKAVQAAEQVPVLPYKPIDGDEARRLSGSPLALGGVFEEDSAPSAARHVGARP